MILAILLILSFGIDICTHVQLDGVSIFLIGWVITCLYGGPLYLIHRHKYQWAENRRLRLALTMVRSK